MNGDFQPLFFLYAGANPSSDPKTRKQQNIEPLSRKGKNCLFLYINQSLLHPFLYILS